MQNQISRLPDSTTSAPHGLVLTGPLKCWLLDERSDAAAIETIRKSPILQEQGKAILRDLVDESRKTATLDQIKSIVGQRFALFHQPHRSEAEWTAWWADYLDALSDLTPFAIEAGMAAWVRSPEAEWMCKPGKLRELAKTVPNGNRWAKAAHRVLKALPSPEDEKPAPIPDSERPSPEQVAEAMAEFKRVMAEKDPLAKIKAKASRPTPSASVDETGVSEEMRQLLSRNAA